MAKFVNEMKTIIDLVTKDEMVSIIEAYAEGDTQEILNLIYA